MPLSWVLCPWVGGSPAQPPWRWRPSPFWRKWRGQKLTSWRRPWHVRRRSMTSLGCRVESWTSLSPSWGGVTMPYSLTAGTQTEFWCVHVMLYFFLCPYDYALLTDCRDRDGLWMCPQNVLFIFCPCDHEEWPCFASDIYEVAKFVHANQSDDCCNWSGTWASILPVEFCYLTPFLPLL